MDISLSSSCITNAKPFLCRPLSKKWQQPRVSSIAISCKSASKLASDENKTTTNFYEVLSLKPNSIGVEEIKKAYRSMALRYHPDVCSPSMKEESTRMFVELNEAYKTLSDPVSREEYDFQLSLSNFGMVSKKSTTTTTTTTTTSDHVVRNRWQEEIVELKKRQSCRMGRKEGSWGSRSRTQNKLRDE